MKRISFIFLFSIFPFITFAQSQKVNIIPKPLVMEVKQGTFTLHKNTTIYCNKSAFEAALFLAEYLRKPTGYKIPVIQSETLTKIKQGIVLELSPKNNLSGEEAYMLETDTRKVSLYANDQAGLLNGVQTIRQLLPIEIENPDVTPNTRWTLPAVKIEDRPRFRWRGYMQDVSRTFYSVEVLKKYLDLMALYKLNVLHFHLTDDQGWRIEIKKYPELTSTKTTVFGGNHNQPAERSGYYTQEQMRDLIEYAARRNITIVPEIDVPGHCWPIILVHPELGVNNVRQPDYVMPFLASWSYWGFQFTPNPLDPTKEAVYEFLGNVFSEIADLFPSEYIHLGGDEVVHRLWESEPKVKEFMAKKGMKSVIDLQSYFVNRVSEIIQSKGKKPVGWNDILQGASSLTKEATIMSWLGEEAIKDAASKGFYTIATPADYLYFDITQADRNDGTMSDLAYSNINSLEHIYGYEPTESLATGEEKYVLGVQANQWPAIPQEVKDMNVQNFPRLLALAEIAWLPKGERNYDDFLNRLDKHYPRLDELKVDYYRQGGYIAGTWSPGQISEEYKDIEWEVTKKTYANGRIMAGFYFTKGDHYLQIRRVQLLENGKVISEDLHEGLADTYRGTSKTKTYQYHLEINHYKPDAQYTVRAEVSGKNGTDSYGNFTYNLCPFIPFKVTEPH